MKEEMSMEKRWRTDSNTEVNTVIVHMVHACPCAYVCTLVMTCSNPTWYSYLSCLPLCLVMTCMLVLFCLRDCLPAPVRMLVRLS